MEGGDDVFEIERILDSSVEKGIQYYKVRWKGFGPDEDTWEPEEHLFGCKSVLDQYWKKTKQIKKNKAKKRKSEQASQLQNARPAKKRKSGRTTNNSTIALIESTSSQDEKIILPDVDGKKLSVKHIKTKQKQGSEEVNSKTKYSKKQTDTAQNNEVCSKKKGSTIKKRRGRKIIKKASSGESNLKQCEVKHILDENQNKTNINQISEALNKTKAGIPVINIEDGPENSKSTENLPNLQRVSSCESFGNRSLGKRPSVSSYEGSPEFVPEYCDETLAYDISGEGEFGYFGDMEYFVKDSIGYGDGNYLKQADKPAIDKNPVEDKDDIQVRDDRGDVKTDECHLKDKEGNVKNVEIDKKDKEGQVKSNEGHVKGDEGHVKSDEDHVKSFERDVKGVQGRVKNVQGRVKDVEGGVKDVEGRMKDIEGHVKDIEGHVKDVEGHMRDEDPVTTVQNKVTDIENPVKDFGCLVDNKGELKEISPVKTDKQQQKENGKEHRDDHSRTSLDAINAEPVNPRCSLAPTSRSEQGNNVSEKGENNDMMYNQGFCDKTANLNQTRTLKKGDLSLKIRSSSSGDSTALTDSECLSPEFAKLPEPRKDYFDRVFVEKVSNASSTEKLNHENKSQDLLKDDFKKKEEDIRTQEVGKNKSYNENRECKDILNDVREVVDITTAEKSAGNKSADKAMINKSAEKQPQKNNTLDISQEKPKTILVVDDVREETCSMKDSSSFDKERKLSEEETAHCLLGLCEVRLGKTSESKRNCNKVTDENSIKIKSKNEVNETKECYATSKKENMVEKKQHSLPKKMSDESNGANLGRKSIKKLLLNLPFVEKDSKQVLDIFCDARISAQKVDTEVPGKCVSSTENNIPLTRHQNEVPVPTNYFPKRIETTSSSISFQESSTEPKYSSISHNVVSLKAAIVSESITVESKSSVALEQQSTPLLKQSSLVQPEAVRKETSREVPNANIVTHSGPKELSSSVNTTETKPETMVAEDSEEKGEAKQTSDPFVPSSAQNNKTELVSCQQGLTISTEVISPVNSKDLHSQGTQHTEGSSTPVPLIHNSSVGSDSAGVVITQVYSKGKNERFKLANDPVSWSGGASKTYPYSTQFCPTSGNMNVKQNVYSDLPVVNSFIVSQLNQKGVSVPPSHINQQSFSTPTSIHVNQKPFSAVAGINWYPERHGLRGNRQIRLVSPLLYQRRPLFYVPEFPISPQCTQAISPNSRYARALHEMAKRRQSTEQSMSARCSDKDGPSSVDADKAWHVKHVDSASKESSSQTKCRAETVVASVGGECLSSNIKVDISDSKGDVSSKETHSNTKQSEVVVDASKITSTDKVKESENKQELKASDKTSDESKSDISKAQCSKTSINLTKSTSNSLSTDVKKLKLEESSSSESSSTNTAITQPKDKNVNKVKDKEESKNKSTDRKEKSTLSFESSKKSLSDGKQQEDNITNQKLRKEKSASRSPSDYSLRSNSKERERSRDTKSSKDQKDKRTDSEKSRGKDKEISGKKQDSSKSDSRSKEDDSRSRHDSKVKEIKKQDSDIEFDFDDYSPGEVISEKPEKVDMSRTGIPTAMSLREVKSAIKQGDSATVLASLAGGMNIDSQDSVTGMTLLMRAVSFGQENIVRLLLNHGANINIKDSTGSTPLIVACEQGFENIVSLLLNVEIDINAKQTLSGETALIKACMNGHYSVVAMLLAYGADCQIRSVSGLTAAQLAVQCGHFEIRDLLESHSKKLQRCVETAIASCLCDSSTLMYPPLLPFVSLYPSEGQKFTYHFHCSNLLLSKTILLFCLRAVFSRSGQVDLSFSKDNGVHTVLLNGSLQSPVLSNNKSVFVLQPKLDTNRLILQTYQSHVHLLVCIYAAELDDSILNNETSPVTS